MMIICHFDLLAKNPIEINKKVTTNNKPYAVITIKAKSLNSIFNKNVKSNHLLDKYFFILF
jgi:hypothetical protein